MKRLELELSTPQTNTRVRSPRRVVDVGDSRQCQQALRDLAGNCERPDDLFDIDNGRQNLAGLDPTDLRLAHRTSGGQSLTGKTSRPA
jgi:hypothetical protein